MAYQMSRLEESVQSTTSASYSRPRCDVPRIRNHQLRRVSPPAYADVNTTSQRPDGASAPPTYTSVTATK